jgi:hypothetical protein
MNHATLPLADARPAAVLRRCACGGKSPGASERERFGARLPGLRRSATSAAAPGLAPPLVHDVLRSPGRPLDPGTRDYMEPRFGHSFADVRVHADARAAESAAAVHAHAYAVGRDVVFGAGRYAPGSAEGTKLIAHELAHVVQQSASVHPTPMPSLEIGSADAPEERAAEAAAERVMGGGAAGALGAEGGAVVRRQEVIPIDLVPVSPEESQKLKEQGIELPTVSDETWRDIGGVADNAGKPLSETEKKKIAALLEVAAPSGPPLAFTEGPRFVLHDTASPVGQTSIDRQAKEDRGPLGKGIYAWVPEAGDATITRPSPFEAKRPSASGWEKAENVIKKADREKAFRQAWSAADPSQHQPALDRALAGTGLTPAELATEQSGAASQLSATSGMIYTTASWAVAEVCAAAASQGAAAVAAPGKDADLTTACATLKPYSDARRARVESTTNVEIVEPENKLSCAHPEKTTPAPRIDYTADQYRSVTLLYLRVALAAGVFPEITTHFWVDRDLRGHCDPRCFNLGLLYDSIAATLGHGKGSTYGDKPSYGKVWGTNNVWWYDPVCGAKP